MRPIKNTDFYNPSLPIAIASRLDKENALLMTKKIIKFLLDQGKDIVLESRIAQRFSSLYLNKMELRDMYENKVQMIISIGGDGTILRVVQNLPRFNAAPILGINMGGVGFLDEVDFDMIFKSLERIVNGDYYLERLTRIASYYNKKRLPDALNEVYVVSSNQSKILHVSVKVDNEFINTAYLDGVIIATSAGSTAYSLSAGGSLIDPRLHVFQIVPVNPFAHGGNIKPIVIPSSSTIEIELLRSKLKGLIIIDGQREYRMFPRTKIWLKKSDSDIKFVRLSTNFQHNFYRKLRAKILLSVPRTHFINGDNNFS